jgi:hypothetical protein
MTKNSESIVLRSVCCGVAAVVVSVPVGIAVLAWGVARAGGAPFTIAAGDAMVLAFTGAASFVL